MAPPPSRARIGPPSALAALLLSSLARALPVQSNAALRLLLSQYLVLLVLQQHPRDAVEHLLNVHVLLRAGLEQLDLHRFRELLRVDCLHGLSIWTVVLVADQNSIDHVAVLFDLVQPSLHVHERVRIRHVVHYDHTVRASVVAEREGRQNRKRD